MTITTIPTIDESKSVAVVKSVSMDPIVNTFEKMYGRGAYVNEEPEPGTERTNADQLRSLNPIVPMMSGIVALNTPIGSICI